MDSSTLCVEMEASPPPPPPALTTNGINHDTPPAEPTVVFDSEIFHSYLLALLPPVIGALPSELDSVFDERVARFAADTGGSLYVVKAKEDSEGMYPRISDIWHHS
jgi:dynein heavy chain 1